MNGLSNDLVSFNFKLLHFLLVPKQELHRTGRVPCQRCNLCDEEEEDDIVYSLINCDFNEGIGDLMWRTVWRFNPRIEKKALLRLDFGEITEDQELPLTT